MTNGSGHSKNRLPILTQRTIAHELRKISIVGRGRFGEVWLAKWRDESVAVKEFFNTGKKSWKREMEVYKNVLLQHNNILRLIAADINVVGDQTSMLLITPYQAFGNLCDYLQHHELTPVMLHRLATSFIAGIAHLHLPIDTQRVSCPSKPAIAHRDIKSRNILVNRNGECVIGGFGSAVQSTQNLCEALSRPRIRVGTLRYMAPEVLDKTLIAMDFNAYKAADIYSVGLVLWEMTRRCQTISPITNETVCDAYEQPYAGIVPSYPCIYDMKLVVCDAGVRPPISERWRDIELLQELSRILKGCWNANPLGRLGALRIEKNLNRIVVNNNIGGAKKRNSFIIPEIRIDLCLPD